MCSLAGLSPATCRAIIAAAEKQDEWSAVSAIGVKTYDIRLNKLKSLTPSVVQDVNKVCHCIQHRFFWCVRQAGSSLSTEALKCSVPGC